MRAALCPSTIPASGSCTRGLFCDYGDDPFPNCDPRAICTDAGWLAGTPGPPSDVPDPCVKTSSPACPSTYDAIANGQVCSAVAWCYYPEARCLCADAVEKFDNDAGTLVWKCTAPLGSATGCSLPRPRTGTPCSALGKTCDYGGCSLEGLGVTLSCTKLGWQRANAACPQ